MNPITSSVEPRTTGYRECARSTASAIALPTVSEASIKSTSVRGTITSCTWRSDALNTSSTISRSSAVSAAWPLTRSSNSSSDIWLRCSFGSTPNARTTMSVDRDSSQITGRKNLAVKSIAPELHRAISSVRNSAKRFGTSSPNTSEK